VIAVDRLMRGLMRVALSILPAQAWIGDAWIGDAWVGEGFPVYWAPTRLAPTELPTAMVTLRLRGGGTGQEPDPTEETIPTDVTIGVTGSSTAARYCTISAGGARWRVDVPALTSDEDFHDEIVVALSVLGHQIWANLTEPSSTTIRLEASPLAGLRGFAVSGNVGITARTDQLSSVVAGPTTGLVELQAYSRERYGFGGAFDLMSMIRGALRRPATDRILADHGLAIHEIQQINDLTGLSGPEWESRAAMDLTVSQLSADATAIGSVASVAVSILHDGTTHELEVTPS